MLFAKRFKKLETELHCIHKQFEQFASSVPMNYQSGVKRIGVGKQWLEVSGGVYQRECDSPTKQTTMLNVTFALGSSIERHNHPENHETIFVVEGEIRDMDTGVTISAGSVYHIPIGQYHSIVSEHGAILAVIFRPKFPRDIYDEATGEVVGQRNE